MTENHLEMYPKRSLGQNETLDIKEYTSIRTKWMR